MLEGYIIGGRNIPVRQFLKKLSVKHSVAYADNFLESYHDAFIEKKDFIRIKNMGFNCVRIPFHYNVLSSGFVLLDRAVKWCRDAGLYAILDMHAAPGAQNADWHADSSGKALFWEKKTYRTQAIALWKKIAGRYADSPVVAGYDILNEPVTEKTKLINEYYNNVIHAVRSAGDSHIIFIEGNMWAQELDFLNISNKHNIVYSIHCYQPLDHTFNFHPGQTYPGTVDSHRWDKHTLQRFLSRYIGFQKKHDAPILVGEFGINIRCYHCRHELKLLRDLLSLFNASRWHWTYWTYKAVAGGVFPNGIYQLLDNPSWVNRQGPVCGWETYPEHSKKMLGKIPGLLKTKYFVKHKELARLLSSYA